MGKKSMVLSLASALLLVGLAGQQTPQEQQTLTKPLQYEVTVVLKLIHVYVTDKKGKPVENLSMDDFSISDNGKPVTLTDFEKHVLQASPATPKTGGPTEPVVEISTPAPPPPRQANRKFFLYIDFAYNNARGIMKAKKAAFHFLDSDVAFEDEVALLSYSMIKGMVVNEYLTTDHPKIRKALESVGQKDIAGRADEIEQQYWAEAEEGLRDGTGAVGEVLETTFLRLESKKIAQTFLQRMTALAKALRFIPGQKQFIFFSTGIPGSLIYGNQAGTPQGNVPGQGFLFETGDTVLRSLVEEMNREFGASGCTFYVFDTRESAMKTSLFERENQTFELGKRTMFSATGAFQDSGIFKSDRITGLASLKQLADKTGGRYFSNIDKYENNFDLVQRITGTYYVLGYAISEQYDGRFHDVKVEVKRKGCEVRAQAGYFNPKPFSEYTDLEKQLHLYDLALNERAFSRMPVNFPMTALSYVAEGVSCLGILAKIPGEITEKFSGKRIEFVAIFFDGKGEISNVIREETDPASLRGRDMAFTAGSVLKPGDYSCRLVIRDMDTGTSAVASAKATIGKPILRGVQLGTPLILAEGAGMSFLEAGPRKSKKAFPWAEVYPYDRSQLSPILTEIPKTASNIRVVIPCSISGGIEPNLALSAYLVNSTSGERSPVDISRSDRIQKGPLEILTLELRITGFAPGTYFLNFNAEDRASKSLGRTFTTIVIPQR